jgi:hypothetical protein
MKSLELDLLPRRRIRPVVWLMLLAGLVLCADAALRMAGLNETIASAGAPVLRPHGASAARLDPVLAREWRSAEQAVQRLALPWDELFGRVEAASYERVALLAIEPDVNKRELSITGEAPDYLAVLTYVARLGEPGMLTDVHLVRHEVRQDEPRQPLRFTVAARWSTTP